VDHAARRKVYIGDPWNYTGTTFTYMRVTHNSMPSLISHSGAPVLHRIVRHDFQGNPNEHLT
jgi:hypothetical protein